MRKRKLLMIAATVVSGYFAAWCVAADASSQLAGTWKGTWEGGGTGRFDMTLAAGAGGMTGGVSVGTDGGDYTAQFTTLSITGNKISAKYNYPLDEQGEITLNGTIDGNKVNGTWALGAKGQDGPSMANGTWTVTKK